MVSLAIPVFPWRGTPGQTCRPLSPQIKPLRLKHLQAIQPFAGCPIIIVRPKAAARKCKSAVKQNRFESRLRLEREISKARLSGPVPILERPFQIVFQKIDGGQQIVAVAMRRSRKK